MSKSLNLVFSNVRRKLTELTRSERAFLRDRTTCGATVTLPDKQVATCTRDLDHRERHHYDLRRRMSWIDPTRRFDKKEN